MKSVCFTGHRNIKETAELKKRLLEQLVKLIAEGADVFYAGGLSGGICYARGQLSSFGRNIRISSCTSFCLAPPKNKQLSGVRVTKGNL